MTNTSDTPIHTERWRSVELSMSAAHDYTDPFVQIEVEAVFVGPDGASVTRPAFWDGGNQWKARFAPPAVGEWRMETTCSAPDDHGLHGATARIVAHEYTGDLNLFRHGFLRVAESGHHLVHDDDTPFFYLGDTHWALPHERWNTSNAEGVASQFRYVVDKRVAQGFTVYQSEPIWHPHPQGVRHHGPDEEPIADLRHGVTEAALDGLRNLDAKFAYIADSGLVHANAMIDWVARPADFPDDYTPQRMARLAKYWAARYGAYPVIWTIAQEIDATFSGMFVGDAMKPWTAAIESLRASDDYRHPLFPHQESTHLTTARSSRFAHEEWHDGFAAQPQWDDSWDTGILAEYWSSGKPALVYESPYEKFWTDERHALSALYKSYLSGMRGYGYGVSGLWNDVYSPDGAPLDAGTEYQLAPEQAAVESSVVTSTEKGSGEVEGPKWLFVPTTRRVWWFEGANSATGDQLGYGVRFLCDLDWWKLTPRFTDPAWSDFAAAGRGFLATDENDLYVALFSDGTSRTGTLRGLDTDAEYDARWFDPRTGEFHIIAGVSIGSSGEWAVPHKPSPEDWVLHLHRRAAV
ncbi:DUF5060 domain-containing protein [Arthrobacter sp. M4]|uniref:DUF5060 domain-containing protein n=1 Tax=Arthrobacter sp. M4 TaxID=218160 RepID=UPI001CDD29E1|nr:DUF5060 domain-containing protein [Arthrobacter sp. M4]MCA4132582.1 DUF4038 domain-containing protein [Arthrobacter sp. M4]